MIVKPRLPHPLDITPTHDGWQCQCRGRDVHTPQKNPLRLPSEKMAAALQQEAEKFAHVKNPNPVLLPRICNVIDNFSGNPQSVSDKIIAYVNHDLLCYRSAYPENLRTLEDAHWQTWLDWAKESLDIDLQITTGIRPIEQSQFAYDAIRARIIRDSLFARAALLEITEILGSAILAFALADTPEHIESIVAASCLHENFQTQRWGETEDHQNHKTRSRKILNEALQFYHLSVP